MPTLHEVQERFVALLFAADADADAAAGCEPGGPARAAGLVPGPDAGVAEGLATYRNNLREGFRKALALEFPVVAKLVGDDYFRQLAREFMLAHPSRSGDLQHVGEPFPAFLRERFADGEYAYFADVATLEWAHCEALVAADAAPLAPEALTALPAERYGEIVFALAPACRLVVSPYPIARIWQANQPSDADGSPPGAQADRIDLGAGADRLLVMRGRDGVEFHPLDPASSEFLRRLAAASTLETAYDAAVELDPRFDPGAALRHLVALGVLIDARLPDATGATNPAEFTTPKDCPP